MASSRCKQEITTRFLASTGRPFCPVERLCRFSYAGLTRSQLLFYSCTFIHTPPSPPSSRSDVQRPYFGNCVRPRKPRTCAPTPHIITRRAGAPPRCRLMQSTPWRLGAPSHGSSVVPSPRLPSHYAHSRLRPAQAFAIRGDIISAARARLEHPPPPASLCGFFVRRSVPRWKAVLARPARTPPESRGSPGAPNLKISARRKQRAGSPRAKPL